MRTSCVMTASPCDVPFGRGKEHITSLCATAQYITVSEANNITAACRNITLYKHSKLWYNMGRKRGATILESKLREMSMDFSVDIINLVKYLKSNHETIIANQIGKSSTSIGENIHEAQYAQGKKDFISKLEIALKEASETGYWLELLHRTNYIDSQQYKILSDKCAAIRVLPIASCKTANSAGENK